MRKKGGFSHYHALEKILRYRAVPAEQKLRWLGNHRQLLFEVLRENPKKLKIFQKLRNGEI